MPLITASFPLHLCKNNCQKEAKVKAAIVTKGIVLQVQKECCYYCVQFATIITMVAVAKKFWRWMTFATHFWKVSLLLLHSCFLRHNFVSMLPSVINMSHFDYNCRWVNKIMREGGQKTKINRYISFTKRLKWSKSP